MTASVSKRDRLPPPEASKSRETSKAGSEDRRAPRRSGSKPTEGVVSIRAEEETPAPVPRRPPQTAPRERRAPRTADLLARVDALERELAAVSALFTASLIQTRDEQQRFAQAVIRLEAQEAPRLSAMQALESAIDAASQQLDVDGARAERWASEGREAIWDLGQRIARAEARQTAGGVSPQERLAYLQARMDPVAPPPSAQAAPAPASALGELLHRVERGQQCALESLRTLEAAFADLEGGRAPAQPPASPSAAATPPRAEAGPAPEAADGAIQVTVRNLSDQVAASGRRSTEAIRSMGHEVIRIARTLDGRVCEVERRSDDRATGTASEMDRLAVAVADQLSRAEEAQMEALDALGGKISGVADELVFRFTASERRSAENVAEGVNEVSERVQRVTGWLNERCEQAETSIDRLRSSEEQAARLFGELRKAAEAVPAEASATADLLGDVLDAAGGPKPGAERPPSAPAVHPPDPDGERILLPAQPPRQRAEAARLNSLPAELLRRAIAEAPAGGHPPAPPIPGASSLPPAPPPAKDQRASNRELITQAREAISMAESERRQGFKALDANPWSAARKGAARLLRG